VPSLETYRKKRDFSKTREPSGKAPGARPAQGAAVEPSYVIQKHAARRLHYDFRLELDGVLLSWAVPKGPSIDPKVKRLAQETEPHPIDYGGFEGTIPKGEYGGGTVMVWDRGSWEPLGDARAAYEKGHLQFTLKGDKLRGQWHLVRIKGEGKAQKSWLLFKARDEFSKDAAKSEVVDDLPNSVLTGRDLEQIAAGAPAKLHAKPKKAEKTRISTPSPSTASAPSRRVEPELATLVDTVPDGDRWLHEIKLDGYRILAHANGDSVHLLTRNGKDWTDRMPTLHAALQRLKLDDAVLDGELVARDERGVSVFQRLQNALNADEDAELVYFVFDLLFEGGQDLRKAPLLERKERVKALLDSDKASRSKTVRSSDHVIGSGPAFFEQACKLGLEGIISKRVDSEYRAGRGGDWLKIKCSQQQEFVVVGMRDDKPARGVAIERPADLKAPANAKARKPKKAAKGPSADYPLTNPDKVLYADTGITKRELLGYYELVAEWMLPHVANRPLTLVRCPNGVGKPCFFQKHPGQGTPPGLRSVTIRETEGKAPYSVIDDVQGLFGLVQLGALEIHTWGSRADDFERPDLLVFDLDPDEGLEFGKVIICARRVREIFQTIELESFVKTTGGKGLHVCIPIDPDLSWDPIKEFTGRVAEALAARYPDEYVASQSKARRRGKIFIDFLRNGRGATFIAPYSTRARPGAPIAVPLAWDELEAYSPAAPFTVRNIAEKLRHRKTEPFAQMIENRQRLRPQPSG
jgi:bifunctional non-homologous end joining protein LigD